MVNRLDGVSHLPASIPGVASYEHVGRPRPAGGEGARRPWPGAGSPVGGVLWWVVALVEVLVGRMPSFLRYGPRVLLDHRIGEYERKLAAAALPDGDAGR